MKSMRPPSAAIFFMTYFTGPRGGMVPRSPWICHCPPRPPYGTIPPPPGPQKSAIRILMEGFLVIFQVKTISHLTSFRISSEAIN